MWILDRFLRPPITAFLQFKQLSIQKHFKTAQHSLALRFGSVWGPLHGGGGGSTHEVKLDVGDHIIVVQGRAGSNIDQIEFFTAMGQVYGPYGGTGGTKWSVSRPTCELVYFSGSAGSRIDSLTLHWEC